MSKLKLDPGLRYIFDGAASRTLHGRRVLSARALAGERQPQPMVLVVARVDPETSIAEVVAKAGGVVHRDSGKVRTLSVPVPSLDRLSECAAIRTLRLSRRMSPRVDQISRLSRLPGYRAKFPGGSDGSGALIGVIDTGVDGSLACFGGRILECWDQTQPGSGVNGFPYGTILPGSLATDSSGHGTHVAGIAAGKDAAYEGVASGAKLIVVKTSFEDAHIQDAVSYVFDQAKGLGLPAVVNLSLGGHGDPHDGTDDLDALIDSQSGPGRIAVVAAGNEGTDSIHTSATLNAGEEAHMGFRVPRGVTEAAINCWYTGSGELEVAVSSPCGTSTPFQPTRPLSPDVDYQLPLSAEVRLSTDGRSPINGDKRVHISLGVVPGTHEILTGRWFLHLRCKSGPVEFHGWMPEEADLTWVTPTQSHLIGSPGSARSAITVGAYTSRTGWGTADGSQWSVGYTLDRVAPFSSPGPLRGGAKKPDIATGGTMVISARSANAQYQDDLEVSNDHVAMQGTSMASPFITGIIATLLGRDPSLTPDMVRARLQAASRGTFSPLDGWGLLEADRLT